MKSRRAGVERRLEVLGIGDAEEALYRQLLARPGASLRDLGTALAMGPRKLQRLLEALELRGLATHSPEHPRRWHPAPPDLAIEALINLRQEELQRARAAAQELNDLALASRQDDPTRIVELIASSDAERLVFEQLHLGAQHEVITLMRPPMRVSQLQDPFDHSVEQEARSRGVRFRSIVDSDYLALPRAVDFLKSETRIGVEARVVPRLPFKMVLADRRMALVPLSLDRPEGPVLLVRSSALLDALYALFGILWERSSPVLFSHSDALLGPDAAGAADQQLGELIALLAAGVNDKTAAHELGISARTLERRLVALMQRLNARTRFEAGWRAALHWAERCGSGAAAGVAAPSRRSRRTPVR